MTREEGGKTSFKGFGEFGDGVVYLEEPGGEGRSLLPALHTRSLETISYSARAEGQGAGLLRLPKFNVVARIYEVVFQARKSIKCRKYFTSCFGS